MLKALFFKWCYRFGFYPIKIKSPQAFYAYLQRMPKSVQEHELSRLSYAIAFSGDHKYYNALLKEFVPNWPVEKIFKTNFVGEGYGCSSLNAYRSVQIGSKRYFEKVYFRAHTDLQKLQWLQDHAGEVLKEKIHFPRIQKVYSGELLSIVYFDFLTLSQEQSTPKENLVKITLQLYEWSKASKLAQIKAPDFIRDYTKHHQYARYRAAALNELKGKGMSVKRFEQEAEMAEYVLTHGDIQKTNIYDNNTILDWDSFGIFPIGMEPAFLLFRFFFKEEINIAPENWLDKNYRSFIPKEDWKDFERNFIYFLFVFSMEIFLVGENRRLENKLLDILKGYH